MCARVCVGYKRCFYFHLILDTCRREIHDVCAVMEYLHWNRIAATARCLNIHPMRSFFNMQHKKCSRTKKITQACTLAAICFRDMHNRGHFPSAPHENTRLLKLLDAAAYMALYTRIMCECVLHVCYCFSAIERGFPKRYRDVIRSAARKPYAI